MNANSEKMKQRAASLSSKPGVYIMKDTDGKVIYVGKAKNIKKRVQSYFAGGDGRAQIAFLLQKLAHIDTIVTESEEQAFILESDLIKKFKPRYNIRLKDDKAFLCVKIDTNKEWPRLELVRRVEDDGAKYFGPYSFSSELRTLLEVIKTVVPLRTCSDNVFKNRQRPCLEYQIKRCSGPCCLPVDPDDYRQWLKQAERILEGKSKQVVSELEMRMEQASEEMRFEEAAIFRDRAEFLQNFSSGTELISHRGENRDVFVLFREGNLVAVTILLVRNGRIGNSKNYSLQDVVDEDGEIIESVIMQFYATGQDIPEEVVVPFELENHKIIEQRLKEMRGATFDLLVPQRGIKKRLLGIAELNAKQHFTEKFQTKDRNTAALQALAKKCGLSQVPRRIECIDISNIQGSDIVASVVAFMDGVADKKSYRRYKITNQGKPDDFGSIAEVVRRRLSRGMKETNLPDLLVIDGGLGQLNAALAERDQLKLELDLISLAKQRVDKTQKKEVIKSNERIFIPGEEEPILLPEGDAVTTLMQRIRDEAHRFAISFHRQRRSQRVFSSILDAIPGIGDQRKGRLLRAFGSVERMKYVAPKDLAMAGRMPLSLAEKLHKALQSEK